MRISTAFSGQSKLTLDRWHDHWPLLHPGPQYNSSLPGFSASAFAVLHFELPGGLHNRQGAALGRAS